MSDIPEYTVGSKEYVKAEVTSDSVISAQPVEIRVNGAWLNASWLGDPGLTRVASVLVDFAGATPGYQTIYVRITDAPEVPLINAGQIVIRP